MATVVAASTLGTMIEWYDFFLYGTAASIVFPTLFFPKSTGALLATFLSLFTFLIGFIARPIGGGVFGALGDRIGRKATLIATLLLMGISTLLIGFLPGYAAIGLAAPIILTILRFCQGLGVGGEWGGSVLLALEYGHRRNRGFWASWPQMGVPLGLLSSSLLFTYFQGQPNFLTVGWRIPFYLSAILILIGLFIRLSIYETPLFAKVLEQRREARTPVREVFRRNPREIFLSAGARFVEQAPFYLFTSFVLLYVGEDYLKLPTSYALTGVNIAAAIELFTIPLFSYLSDRIGRRPWYLVGCVLMAVFAFPYFMLLNSKNPVVIALAIVLSLALFHAWVYGPQAALISERFSTRLRYSGASLGYQLAAPFAGGLAPIIGLALLTGTLNLAGLGLTGVKHHFGAGSWQAVSIYIIVLAVISFLSVLGLRDLTKADISQEEIVVAEPSFAQE